MRVVAAPALLAALFSGAVVSMAAEAPSFALGEKETIVFAGDSITAAGDYVMYVEAYLRTRFPERSYTIVPTGRRSETLSGLTEPQHPGPRPTLFERFDRDVAARAPTWTVASYGMNDGIYHPYSDERLGCFQQGVGQLLANVRALKSRLLLLTPPAWDGAGRGEPELAPGESWSYKKPYPGYDDVLHRYSEWLETLRGPDVEVADVHASFKAHLEARRIGDPAFKLQKDSIHPDATGHLLVAMAVLQAWNAPALVSEAVIDVRARKVLAGDVKLGAGASFSWTSKLPMPFDERWDPASVTLERLGARFNRQTLTVRGLDAGRYALRSDGADVGVFTEEDLAAGIDVAALEAFPTTRRSREVLDLLRARKAAEGQESVRIEARIADRCRPAPVGIVLRTLSPGPGGSR